MGGSDCRSRVIYGADRNNLLPPPGLDRYIGLDTEQDSSFEFVLMGVPLSGIAPKRCIPFILTTPSELPDKKLASIRNGSRVDPAERGNIRYPDFVVCGSAAGVEVGVLPWERLIERSRTQSWVVPPASLRAERTGRCRPCNASPGGR